MVNSSNNFPEWEEWNGLTEEQRRYSKYKILQDMNTKLTDVLAKCEGRQATCSQCFMSIKDAKWLIWAVRGIYTIIIGGLVVELLKWHSI